MRTAANHPGAPEFVLWQDGRQIELSEVYASSAYSTLCLTHVHRAIDHAKAYAIGEIHVNGMKNFWCLLKRTIGGTYTAVAPFHLGRYVAEQCWRFNNRCTDDGVRFQRVLGSVVGKRLTYRTLTGQGDAGFMGIE